MKTDANSQTLILDTNAVWSQTESEQGQDTDPVLAHEKESSISLEGKQKP